MKYHRLGDSEKANYWLEKATFYEIGRKGFVALPSDAGDSTKRVRKVVKRGGAGESHCSAACHERGGNAIFAVSMGSQQGRAGKCITCGAHAITGKGLAIPTRGMIALYCRSCVTSGTARSHIASIKQCAWCGTSLD